MNVMWGRIVSCARVVTRALSRLKIGLQVANLPH
jgi:hypothetical protein